MLAHDARRDIGKNWTNFSVNIFGTEDATRSMMDSVIRIAMLTGPRPQRSSPERRHRFEPFKKMLVQTVPCQAATLDLRNGGATVLALRQMQYENALRLMTRRSHPSFMDWHMNVQTWRGKAAVNHVATAAQVAKLQGRCNEVSIRSL